MYGIDSSVQSESGFKSIEVGISENNLLEKVTFGPSSTEKKDSPEALQFHFKNTSGASFRHLEFPIDDEREKLNGDKYYEACPASIRRSRWASRHSRISE